MFHMDLQLRRGLVGLIEFKRPSEKPRLFHVILISDVKAAELFKSGRNRPKTRSRCSGVLQASKFQL